MAETEPALLALEPESATAASAPLPAATGVAAQPYRVLARKYRPQVFADLIGQEAMVHTLGNAIRRDRVAHAFLLTGVRGVGKTSTARLIAKALNCIGPDGKGGPTIDPCGQCEPCVAIAEGRHIDVVEMDAASNTGVDDVREIIDAVRYASVSARTKVYIIDEVHMLSKNAFNALLKTLEEPPPHVKFLFATTEVNKVPVTVLSRCQRFDLRRIPPEQLIAHFDRIVALEGVSAEPEALALIARAAEGSVRDGLSILDQAIAHADWHDDVHQRGSIAADQVRAMLGLSDRGALRALLGHILGGDAPAALDALSAQIDLGVDPASVMRGLLELVHAATIIKVGGADDPARSPEDQAMLANWAQSMSFATLHRLWQLLLKGHDEVARAVNPAEAADMAVLRVIHAGTLPDPDALKRHLDALDTGTALQTSAVTSGSAPAPAPAALPVSVQPDAGADAAPFAARPVTAPRAPEVSDALSDEPRDEAAAFRAVIDQLESAGRHLLGQKLRDYAGLIACDDGALTLAPRGPLGADFVVELETALRAVSGRKWRVELRDDASAPPPLKEQEKAAAAAARAAIWDSPAGRAVRAAFPDAELTGWSDPASLPAANDGGLLCPPQQRKA